MVRNATSTVTNGVYNATGSLKSWFSINSSALDVAKKTAGVGAGKNITEKILSESSVLVDKNIGTVLDTAQIANNSTQLLNSTSVLFNKTINNSDKTLIKRIYNCSRDPQAYNLLQNLTWVTLLTGTIIFDLFRGEHSIIYGIKNLFNG